MRLICITLLLLNLGYFGYMQLRIEPKSAPGQINVEAAGVALVSEVPIDPRQTSPGTGGQLAEDVLLAPITQSTAVESPGPVDAGALQDVNAPGCNALGPFEDLFRGQRVVEQLATLGSRVYLKAIDSQSEARSYRVILPPAKSKIDAFRRLKELKTRAIDSYLIAGGKDALVISLGVFSTEMAALKLQAKIQNRGYNPIISEMIKYERQFWIFDQQHNQPQLSAEVLASIEVTEPSVRLQKKQCPETEN